MWDAIGNLLNTDGFPPRWNCGTAWTPLHGWVHILSDICIFGAYAAIPIVLTWFILRRRDIPFPGVFWLFAAFILFCGIGHLIEAIIFWVPVYRVAAVVKLATAIVSWITVFALAPVITKALTLPGLEQINRRLSAEVDRRRAAETRMKKEMLRFKRVNDDLQKFASATADREIRMIELKREVNHWADRAGAHQPYQLPGELCSADGDRQC